MKKNIIKKWKEISIEDKILTILEYTCYLLILGTILAIIFVISNGFVEGAWILSFVIIAFIACGLNARSSRDSYKFNQKTNNKKTNKLLSLN